MKKTRLFTLLSIFPLLLLSSCINYGTLRTNYIEAGVFKGPDLTDAYMCTLTVTAISKKDYIKANGVNVVKDAVREGYYLLSFVAISENETITYDFISLEDPFDGSPKTFAHYRDANGSWFDPYDPNFSSSNRSKEEHMKYDVTINYAEGAQIVAAKMLWTDPSSFE